MFAADFSNLAGISAGSLTPVLGLFIDTALKGSLLILAAAIAAYLLRNRSASARHAAWTAAVVGHLALPILTLLAPQWRLPILPAPPWLETAVATPAGLAPSATLTNSRQSQTSPSAAAANSSTALPVNPAGPAAGSANRTSAQPVNPPAQSRGFAIFRDWPALSVLALLWIVGSLVVLLRLAIGTWRVGRLAKNGERVADGEWLSLSQRLANGLGIARPLTLLRGDSLAVPVTWGVVYPAVLLPPDSDEWPEARRRFVLVHEMAHVKRFDALTQLLAQMTIAILWFDPLIWVAAHRMRVEREHACDDYVLRDGTTPSLYAGELLEMVQSIGSPRHEHAAPAFAALAMARRSEFEGRMLAILDPKLERHTLGRRSAMAAAAMVTLLILPLAALRPFRADTPATVVPESSSRVAATVQSTSVPVAAVVRPRWTCDTVNVNAPVDGSSLHIHVDQHEGAWRELQYMVRRQGRCAEASMIGEAEFSADEKLLTNLPSNATADFQERVSGLDRSVKVRIDRSNSLIFNATMNGQAVPFDSGMQAWLSNLLPEVLTETAVNAPQRVLRLRREGGVPGVLAAIRNIRSPNAKRAHYEALLDGKPLSSEEYDAVRRHATRNLSDGAADLDTILTRLTAMPPRGVKSLGAAVERIAASREAMGEALEAQLEKSGSSTDSARLMTQYAQTDDPQMILMALEGAKKISSDTDRRVLLQTVAARALGRRSVQLRKAYFEATAAMTSDTDLRVTLTSALPYGHADPEVTIAVFKSVGRQMTSDSDKRVTLSAAIEQRLIKTPAIREAFMAAARTIESDTDFTNLMQAALKQ